MALSTGTIAEIKSDAGLAYVQLIHTHTQLGQLIRVIDGVWRFRPASIADVAALPTRFYCFFPLTAAIRAKLVSAVGSEPIPSIDKIFPTFRVGLQNPRTKKVEAWSLWDGENSVRIDKLSAEHRKLSGRLGNTLSLKVFDL